MVAKAAVKRYKFKNIGMSLAAVLIFILAITSSCANNALERTVTKKENVSSQTTPKKNVTFAKNYTYQTMDNSSMVGEGNLVLVNEEHLYTATPDELDAVYSYLFNKSGTQIMSTSSTSLYATKETFTQLNKLISAFYDKTHLATIMVSNAVYQNPDAESDGTDNSQTDGVAPAGASANGCYEHDTGLAVDLQLYDASTSTYPAYDGSGSYSWIDENCWKYGFILRYTQDKSDITGVKAMANHYRYVGVPFAEIMNSQSLSLEEFSDFIQKYNFEKPYQISACDGHNYAVYYVKADSGKTTSLPIPLTDNNAEYKYIVSGDNVGGYIVSVDMTSATEKYDMSGEKLSDDSDTSSVSETAQ